MGISAKGLAGLVIKFDDGLKNIRISQDVPRYLSV